MGEQESILTSKFFAILDHKEEEIWEDHSPSNILSTGHALTTAKHILIRYNGLGYWGIWKLEDMRTKEARIAKGPVSMTVEEAKAWASKKLNY